MTLFPVSVVLDDDQQALIEDEYRSIVRLHPTGNLVAYVRAEAPNHHVVIHDLDTGSERVVLSSPSAPVTELRWTGSGRYLCCVSFSASSGQKVDFVDSADGSTRATLSGVREFWTHPTNSMVLISQAQPGGCGLTTLALDETGAGSTESLQTRFHRLLVDRDLRVRGGMGFDGAGRLLVFLGRSISEVEAILAVPTNEVDGFEVAGFDASGECLTVLSGAFGETRSLASYDLTSSSWSSVFADDELDIDTYPIATAAVLLNPVSGLPDLAATVAQRPVLHGLTEATRSRLAGRGWSHDEPTILLDRSADDNRWLVATVTTDRPISYRCIDFANDAIETPVFDNRRPIAGHALRKLEDFSVRASDGVQLNGYWLPSNSGSPAPQPCVVMVHGGPASRDYWRFDALGQFFSTLGFSSLHVNYRGSSGRGSRFRRRADGEWGARVQEDLYESVEAAIGRELIDPRRVAFFGWSFGGYVSLLAAIQRQDLARCAVAMSPFCDPLDLLVNPPPFWRPLRHRLEEQIRGPEGSTSQLTDGSLAERSLEAAVHAWASPMFVVHGAFDRRTPVEAVDRFVRRAEEVDAPVEYLRFESEGHAISNPNNRQHAFQQIATFLRKEVDDV